MTSLRLLADDLTGALDAAAEFVPLTGPVQAFWHGSIPAELPVNAALDSGTRELDGARAAAVVRGLAHHLSGSAIAFKKIDSLLRGPTIAELAAAMAGWEYCVLAPAFPFQGRVTRGGRQYARHADGDWRPAGDDLVAALRDQGVEAWLGRVGIALQPGITVFDAETEDDLLQIVASVRRCPHPVLWSGTGGLAQALAADAAGGLAQTLGTGAGAGVAETLAAGASGGLAQTLAAGAGAGVAETLAAAASGGLAQALAAGAGGGLAQALAAGASGAVMPAPLAAPILGLFGSDQHATAAQLLACDAYWAMLPDGGPASADRVAGRLAASGIALVSFDLPVGTPRPAAADHIGEQIDRLTRSLASPGTLIVAGGETLRRVCQSLGATSLEVQGRIVPGVPRSVLCGGRWDGVTVVSKSGAFGHPHLLRDLLVGFPLPVTSQRRAS
jgi:uncharacterized protein YgbK (DUF1537 family)